MNLSVASSMKSQFVNSSASYVKSQFLNSSFFSCDPSVLNFECYVLERLELFNPSSLEFNPILLKAIPSSKYWLELLENRTEASGQNSTTTKKTSKKILVNVFLCVVGEIIFFLIGL